MDPNRFSKGSTLGRPCQVGGLPWPNFSSTSRVDTNLPSGFSQLLSKRFGHGEVIWCSQCPGLVADCPHRSTSLWCNGARDGTPSMRNEGSWFPTGCTIPSIADQTEAYMEAVDEMLQENTFGENEMSTLDDTVRTRISTLSAEMGSPLR